MTVTKLDELLTTTVNYLPFFITEVEIVDSLAEKSFRYTAFKSNCHP